MLELLDIKKIYHLGTNEICVLKNINLTIEDGDFVAIMGPSGSGKSTLMHILGLLDVASSGSYKINGLEVSNLTDDELAVLRRKEIGFIFQQFNLLHKLKAYENVALPLLYSEKIIDYSRAKDLLKKVGLEDRLNHRPNELSGGQQQRVAIARSLINNPKIILADEPTGNLDSASEKEIINLLKELNKQGMTVIIVTHEDEIAVQANRIIKLRDGVIQSDIRTSELKKIDPVNVNIKDSESKNSRYRIPEFYEYIKQGLKVLKSNKVRTALSMLGIMIGVASVVSMMALGGGAKKAIQKQLASLGSNLLVLSSGNIHVGGVAQESGSVVKLSIEDAEILKNKIKYIKETVPTVDGKIQITYKNKNWNSQLMGTTPEYVNVRAAAPEYGRFFTSDENKKRTLVALLGTTVLKELFGSTNPIGETVKINKINFLVIGVLPSKGASGFRDQDDIVVAPLFTAMYRVFGKKYLDYINIEIDEANNISVSQDLISNFLLKKYNVPLSQKEYAFRIRNMADIQNAVSQSNKVMTLLLAAIAGVSLLVGGIGIMNIMLVSVTERTKEVGLRKAIGAMKKNILLQFLIESSVMSIFGGLLGIIFGWLISSSLSIFAGWETVISIQSILLAFFSSASIGIIFGIYPAKKAASLNPIDALRFE